MLEKCQILSFESAELVPLHSNLSSLTRAAFSSSSLPVLTSTSITHSIFSLRHGPPAVVSVVGQLHPLVHGCAGRPRLPLPQPPPLDGGGGGGSEGDDTELSLAQLKQRQPSNAHASISTTESEPADPLGAAFLGHVNTSAACWARPTRNDLLRLGQRFTAAQAAVRLLRIVDQDHELICSKAERPLGLRSTTQSGPSSPTGDSPQYRSGSSSLSQGTKGVPSLGDNPDRYSSHIAPTAGLGEGLGVSAAKPHLHVRPQPDPLHTHSPGQFPPTELLSGLDQLALSESLQVLQPLLPRLSVTQLQRILETLAAVRHAPTDPWFHEWLLASGQQLKTADATEVYGMLVAMRVLRLRPRSREWVSGAVWALSEHLPQLDAVQVVELLGCFSDMALRPPEKLLSRAFALLLPDLPQLQPRQVLDFLSSCSMLRVAAPAHILSSVYGALTPSTLAVAPVAQLCKLTAALAQLRAQPPVGLLLAIVARVDAVLRSAVAPAGAGHGDGVEMMWNSRSSPTAEKTAKDAASFASSSFSSSTAAVSVATGTTETGAAGQDGDEQSSSKARTLRPRRGKVRRLHVTAAAAATTSTATGAAATTAAPEESTATDAAAPRSSILSPCIQSAAPDLASPLSPPSELPPPPLAAILTTSELSRLLRDLRLLEAPLPPEWGVLCGLFLGLATDSVTSVMDVSHLLRSVARCGLTLPPAIVGVVAARLETSLRTATEQRCRWRQRRQRWRIGELKQELTQQPWQPPQSRVAAAVGGLEGVDGADWDGAGDMRGEEASASEGDGEGEDNLDGRGATDLTGLSEDGATKQWTPQALSNTIIALVPHAHHLRPSMLRALYDNLYDKLERFDLPELSATLHSLPLLVMPPRRTAYCSHSTAAGGAAAAGNSDRAPPVAPSELVEPLPPPPAPLMTSFLSCLRGRMKRMQPWQLSMCLFALLRLGVRPEPAWMDAFLGQVYRKLPYMNEVQVATIPWVVAKMSYRPQACWVERMLAAAAGQLSCFSPRHLCQLLWAVAAMGYTPESVWMARWLEKARGCFRTSDGRTLSALAWAVARLGHRPERMWLQELCEHLARRLPYTSPRAVSNSLAALAALGYCPDAAWLEAVKAHIRARLPPLPQLAPATAGPSHPKAHPSSAEGGCYSLQDMSHVCYSLARLGHRPSDIWLDCVANAASQLALGDPGPVTRSIGGGADAVAAAHAKHIALLMLALARHHRRPPPAAWAALLEGLYPSLPYASPQALAVLLTAAAGLRLPLRREHAGALLLASHRRMASFSIPGLAMAFRGFVELGVDPGPRWLSRLEEVLLQQCQMQVQQKVEQEIDVATAGATAYTGATAAVEEMAKEEEEEEGVGEMSSGSVLEQGMQLPRGPMLSPRERVSMLWAAVTLETCILEEPARTSYPQILQRHSPQHHPQAASTAGTADVHGHPPLPRWVRKPGPLRQPLRLARLIGLLLPSPGEPAVETEERPPLYHSIDYSSFSDDGDGGIAGPLSRSGTRQRGMRPLQASEEDAASESIVLHARGRGGTGERRSVQLACYSGRDLALLCWALGRLRLRPRGLIAALLAEVSRRLAATGRSLLNSHPGAAVARSGFNDSLIASLAADASFIVSTPKAAAAAMGPAGMPWEVAAVAEPNMLKGAADAKAASGFFPQSFTQSEMAMVYWGLSSVGVWPTAAWRSTAAAAALQVVREGGNGLSPRYMATVLAALARWLRRPQRRRKQLADRAPVPSRIRRESPVGDARADIRVGYPAEMRFRAFATALARFALVDSAAHMPQPQQPEMIQHQHQHPHPLHQQQENQPGNAGGTAVLAPPEEQRCYDAHSLAMLMWALANLTVVRRLPDPWIAAFVPVSLRVLAQLPPSYRVTMLDSLSRLGFRPGAAWLYKAEQVVMHGSGLSLASSYRGLDAALQRMSE
ncbi:hypothetical protein VaNZ11_005067 [Volvox africanus]|uniref:Uncharacterized protein n=1 Tax=Volvox africanus TaxID=51714 RepID=A0ABQ5RXU3_9CHLO|nr:hypothetical protein VaNZ11_005067 [Volvox africanus]